jgi:hypothetical protein
MKKLLFSFNMTLEGYIDPTAVIADDERHERASELLRSADTVIYGRIAYQLMADFWPAALQDPSLSPSVKEFADTINGVQKIVYSKTMKKASWNTKIVREVDPVEIRAMKLLPARIFYWVLARKSLEHS